jgi:hypothetical protein
MAAPQPPLPLADAMMTSLMIPQLPFNIVQ